jgi:cytosine/uracil/thiamine/allantoin permease
MRTREYPRTLRAACILALVALALMVWSLLEPTPLPVLVAMSVGQVLGTISLVMFGAVVVADMRQAHLERPPRSSGPPR